MFQFLPAVHSNNNIYIYNIFLPTPNIEGILALIQDSNKEKFELSISKYIDVQINLYQHEGILKILKN